MESSRKIAIDMYVQAWADGETELGPSAYYFTGHELGKFIFIYVCAIMTGLTSCFVYRLLCRVGV